MSQVPSIPKAEWKVMQVLWAESPLSSAQVIATLASESWHPNTIKTLLNRLYKKGVVGVKKQNGRMYLYRPIISKTQGVRAESQLFLDKVFGGAVKPLLVHFMERQKLNARDVAELKELLQRRQR